MSEVGLVALPMTFIIITGGIDLSVGSILGLCAVLLGVLWQVVGVPLGVVLLLVLLVGVLAGLFNALLIVRVGVPPLIMTLATLALYRGLAQGVSQARSVTGYPEWFFFFGQGQRRRATDAAVGVYRDGRRVGGRAPHHYARAGALRAGQQPGRGAVFGVAGGP